MQIIMIILKLLKIQVTQPLNFILHASKGMQYIFLGELSN